MSEEVEFEYKQDGITPFWQKLPFFFAFPFRVGPLIFIACIVAASALAGLAVDRFGLMLKGTLVYLGLRYAFNVLELFSQGRFEGHSVDHTLWGPEKRPAKLGLLIVLYLAIGIFLGNVLVEKRIATSAAVQEQLIGLYKADHAEEIAERERERAEFNARYDAAVGDDKTTADVTDDAAAPDDAEPAEPRQIAAPMAGNPPDASLFAGAMSREEILAEYKPRLSNPLWFKLLPAWYWIVMVALSLMLPAAAIVIALEDRFFKALNPAHVIFLSKSMGSTYLILWALFVLIAGTRQFALTAGAGWPVAVRFPLEMGVSTYLGLVLFAMMGYALYEYHQELSLEVKVDFDSHRKAGGAEAIAGAGSAHAAIRATESKDPLERKVRALVAEGKFTEAIAEVKDGMRYDRYDPDLNTLLHSLHMQNGDAAAAVLHGHQWITSLTRAGRGYPAYDALRALLAVDPSFTVQDGDAVLPIGTAAIQKRDFDLAVNLMRNFDVRFPSHKDTAALLFLNAKIASEHQRKHEKAIKMLRVVLERYPEDAVASETKTYLAVLEKILAQVKAVTPGQA